MKFTIPSLHGEAVNLALKENGAMVYTSSFADTAEHYSESLIDGNPSTAWQAFDTTLPQWIELRWAQEARIERIALKGDAKTFGIESWRAEAWGHDGWRKLGESKNDSLSFQPVSTKRVRVTLEAASVLPVRLSAIEVFGSKKPSLEELQAYWSAHYIWHSERDQKLQVGKPRYFRTVFTIPKLSEVTSAFLQSRSNDQYTAYLNGQKVDAGKVDIRAIPVKDALREGENVLAYEAIAHSNPGWGWMELLGELTINTASGVITVASGPTWKSSEQLVGGWDRQGFDDAKWSKVAVFVKPPGEVWGRIPFHPVAEGEAIEVLEDVVEPSRAKPGETVKARFRLKPGRKLTANYAVELQAGEIEVNRDRSDYTVATEIIIPSPPLNEWKAGEDRWVEFGLDLPDFAPGGPLPLRLRGAALDGSGKSLRFLASGGGEWKSNANLTVDHPVFQGKDHPGKGDQGKDHPAQDKATLGRVGKGDQGKDHPAQDKATLGRVGKGDQGKGDPAASGAWPATSIEWEGPCAVIRVDGKKLSPIIHALQSPSFERFHEYVKTGPRIFRLETNPYCVEDNTDYSSPHLAFLDQHISNLLRTVPDAYIMLYLELRASGAWKQKHPEACLKDAFGNSLVECLHAREYQDAVVQYLERILAFLQSKPYASRIIGVLPYIGPEVESCIGGISANEGGVDRSKWTVGDWNPQAIQAFREFLRRKYGNDPGKLRAAWKNAAVDFNTAAPDRTRLVEAAPDHNLFRSPREGRMRADYFEFLSSIVPTVLLEKAAKTIKKATGGKALVGSYFGYALENLRGINPPCGTQQDNHFWFPRMIDSLDMDFFASPLHYDYSRLAGTRFFPFQPYASVGLHKKLYIAELDHRTFICGDPTYGRHRSQEETVAILQRDLASTLIGGSGAWFADWSSGTGRRSHGFFMDDRILATIKRAYEIHEKALQTRTSPVKAAQIAVVISTESPWHQDTAYPAIIYNTLVCSVVYQQMAAIGAPFDILMMDDLKSREVRDRYKLFVMINPFYLSRDQSRWIEELKGGGRTLLWFYAPGYVSDEEGLSAQQVSKTTGLGIKLLEERSTPMFRVVEEESPVIEGVNAQTTVTLPSFGTQLNFSTIMPTEIYPNFEVTDSKATALGKDDKGRIRFAARDFGSWRSVYSAVPDMPRAILRNIARVAGVHFYTEAGVVVDANDRCLMLHYGGKSPRSVTVTLPQPRTVTDLYENKVVATNQAEFEVAMPRIGTRVFQLDPP
ncbi:MAG: hypothetical protein HY360_17015 [Verrucomicrobia bacterium]|nr:hypothetical protein [Verrucomicrobiota bacterium]